MGCCKSKPGASAPSGPPAGSTTVDSAPGSVAPPSGSKGQGKGVKGKGQGKGFAQASKFQIELSGKWEDYSKEEDGILKRAFLIGQKNCKFALRGQQYEYDFVSRIQKNLGTNKERKIRPPIGVFPPKKPLLPPGPMVVVQMPEGAGSSFEVPDPNNPGCKIQVALPPHAKPGAHLAVPVPQPGESMESVATKQQEYTKGTKLAIGAAMVGAAAVGGVVLGDHLSGGALQSWAETSPEVAAAGDWAAGATDDVGDWAGGAADWAVEAAHKAGDWGAGAAETAGEWAGDAGDWAGGAADSAGDWGAGAVEDVGAWGEAAVEDVGDWLGGAGDDIGDFVTSLF